MTGVVYNCEFFINRFPSDTFVDVLGVADSDTNREREQSGQDRTGQGSGKVYVI